MPNIEEKLNVPVINVTPLLLAGSLAKDVQDTVEAIGKACAEWGFFYIVNHQIQSNFLNEVRRLSREFFQKPIEFKRKIAQNSNNFRGFSDAEFTKRKLDWKEVYDFGYEVIKNEEMNLDVRGKNQWPEEIPQFKSVMLKYFDEMHFIAEKLMGAIFTSLGVDPSRFEHDFEGSRETSIVRMNYYPICPNPNAHLGVGPHADPSVLTILWQDMDVSSLQVEKNGTFYDVHPYPDSYVVNIGDMVQVWSNGLYKAPVHRVLANHHNARHSAPFFYTPSYHCNVQPLETCISDKNPCHYRPINWGEFIKGRYQGNLADIGEEIQIKHYQF